MRFTLLTSIAALAVYKTRTLPSPPVLSAATVADSSRPRAEVCFVVIFEPVHSPSSGQRAGGAETQQAGDFAA